MRTRLVPLTMIILSFAACGGGPEKSKQTTIPAANISVAIAATGMRTPVETLPGTVRATTTAALTARVPGVITRLDAGVGKVVKAGDLIAELDAQEILAKRDQAAAAAQQAAQDLKRVVDLLAKQAATQSDRDAAEARNQAAQAALAEAKIMVSYTRVTAPFDGIVLRRLAEVGDLAAPGRPLCEIEDPRNLRLEVAVPESLADNAALGSRRVARIESAAFSSELVVVEVAPASDPQSRTVLVKLALPPEAKGLRTGQFGRMDIPLAAVAQLAVPRKAVLERGQLSLVFVIVEGKALLRLVKTGAVLGDNIIIRAGLAAGEQVATSGVDTLRDGQAVVITP